ncbi:lactate racemase domain-containing protein [Ancylobacter dichloromethanicus]
MPEPALELAFGRGALHLALPPEAEPTVLRKAALPKLPDNLAGIRHAFDHPVGSAPLRELATGCASACILICDITRPVPNRLFPAADDRDPDRGRYSARRHHRAGGDRAAPAQ